MSKSDSEIWKLILKGDRNAWEILVNRYQALVYTIPSRIGLDLADCADCFQQTWMLLYENRKKIKDPERLSAWLSTTAKRESLKRLRQKSADSDVDESELIDSACLPDQELENLELQAQLEAALAHLDSRCQKIIEAFFFQPEKISYEEIAAILKISANSLGAFRQRCLKRLKNILTEMGYADVRKEDL